MEGVATTNFFDCDTFCVFCFCGAVSMCAEIYVYA